MKLQEINGQAISDLLQPFRIMYDSFFYSRLGGKLGKYITAHVHIIYKYTHISDVEEQKIIYRANGDSSLKVDFIYSFLRIHVHNHKVCRFKLEIAGQIARPYT